MNSSQIKCFLAAAKYLNFTKAAKEVFLSQPGLSRQISTLENELGVMLFERLQNSVELSPAGELCVKYFSRWANDLDQLTDDLRRLSQNSKKRLVIGGLADHLIGKCYESALSYFWEKRPDVELRLSYYPAPQLAAALSGGDIDIAILPEHELENTRGISFKRTMKDRCCLVVPVTHPKANKAKPSLLDFQDEVFLMLENEGSDAVSLQHKLITRTDNFKPRAIRSVPTLGTLSMLLQSGSGISALSKWHSLRDAPFLKFIEVPEIGYRVEAVAWRTDDNNPIVREFVDKIETYEETPDRSGGQNGKSR